MTAPVSNKPATASVLALMDIKVTNFYNKTALSMFENGSWLKYNFGQLGDHVRNLAGYLIEFGIQPNDRIAILSESRPQWPIPFFASARAGAICVPIDTKLTIAEIIGNLSDAQPRLLFISRQFIDYVREIKSVVTSIEEVILLNGNSTLNEDYSPLRRFEQLVPNADHNGRERSLTDTSLIIYTSGTTGKPKGVMISFETLIFEVERLQEIMKPKEDDVFLSILPLNHMLELTCGLLGPLHVGAEICYSPSLYPEDFLRMMVEKRVTLMVVVPLFLKLVKNGIEREVRHKNQIQQSAFKTALGMAKCLPHHSGRRLLFPKVHERFGNRLRAFMCGGARLDKDVADFFDCMGIPTYQGYGLTETGPVISVNTPTAYKTGSVGKPLEGIEVCLAEGEILTRGPHVMQGYYKRADLTSEVIDKDGWFHTGDLGVIDKKGFIFITGRSKNLIALPGGKKVQAEEVEAAIRSAPSVKESCVLAGYAKEKLKAGNEAVYAILVPTNEARQNCGHNLDTLEKQLLEELEASLTNLAAYKHPSRVLIRLEPFPRTSSGKIKRVAVKEWLEMQEQEDTSS